MDSANLVQMMLIDKGYYDYDYEKEEPLVLVSTTRKTKEQINRILRNFGLPVQDEDEEEKLQQFIIREEQ